MNEFKVFDKRKPDSNKLHLNLIIDEDGNGFSLRDNKGNILILAQKITEEDNKIIINTSGSRVGSYGLVLVPIEDRDISDIKDSFSKAELWGAKTEVFRIVPIIK